MKDKRTIYERDVPYLFALLRTLPGVEALKGRIMRSMAWQNNLFYAWRELFGRPWPGNIMRSTGASVLLVLSGMEVCGKVMGHQFERIDEILLEWYYGHMSESMAQKILTMAPEPWSEALAARYKYKLYRGWIDCTGSTHMWPNYQVQGQHTVGMGSKKMDELLREKRPIRADANGRTIEIEVTRLDGTKTVRTVTCRTTRIARKKVHRIRVASYTGQGVIDISTGGVTHYERNYGPCLGQRIFKLINGAELRRQMEEKRLNVRDEALRLGTSIDIFCRYFKMGDPRNRTVHAGNP